jgi:AcrR family transcriptional regulator
MFAQGMASRNVRPQARGKYSGLPFGAKFYERTALEDVAQRAGMTRGAIHGNFKSKDDSCRSMRILAAAVVAANRISRHSRCMLSLMRNYAPAF